MGWWTVGGRGQAVWSLLSVLACKWLLPLPLFFSSFLSPPRLTSSFFSYLPVLRHIVLVYPRLTGPPASVSLVLGLQFAPYSVMSVAPEHPGQDMAWVVALMFDITVSLPPSLGIQ